MQQEFYKLLVEEKKKGTTLFYSTHILSEISKICDRVGIIKNGKLLKVEKIGELLKKNLDLVTVTAKDVKGLVEELNVEVIEKNKNTVKFKNVLPANELIKIIAKYDIEDILIEEASLEDIFLHYYE